MQITEVHSQINNLDLKEGLRRKFGPQHSLMQLDRNGTIVAVYRFKSSPSEADCVDALNRHPRTIQIPASVNTYPELKDLQQAIEKTMGLFNGMK